MINNNTPYLRNKIPTLITLSAAAIAVLAISSLTFSHFLLQPAQAETTVTFQPSPTIVQNSQFALTFEAKGTACSSYCHDGEVTSGTFQMNTSEGVYDDGSLAADPAASSFTNDSSGITINLSYVGNKDAGSTSYLIVTSCSTSDGNDISVTTPDTDNLDTDFYDPVECTLGGGEGEAHSVQPTSSSSSPVTGTTSTQDSDRDGIPDSSDRCTHNSNTRCFKEDS